VSIDTTKAEVARAAVAAGATIVNDVSGGLFDPAIGEAVGDATYIVGHLRGRTLAEVFAAEHAPSWEEVAAELVQRLAALPPAVAARAWVDPGLGFGKGSDAEGNLSLIRHTRELADATGRPVCVGPSRKRFLKKLLGGEPAEAELDAASVAACLAAARAGAFVLRSHNVTLLRAALTVYTKL
jgi:dihydropteroate synthase